jgi:hypothetical protein
LEFLPEGDTEGEWVGEKVNRFFPHFQGLKFLQEATPVLLVEKKTDNPALLLVEMQAEEGFWEITEGFAELFKLPQEELEEGVPPSIPRGSENIWFTVLALQFFKLKCKDSNDWEAAAKRGTEWLNRRLEENDISKVNLERDANEII